MRSTRCGLALAAAAVLAFCSPLGARAGISFAQNTPNPFQGQNLPPYGQSVDSFPVQVQALVQDLYRVDEVQYTFSIVFGLLFTYEDAVTVENVMTDSSDNCTFFCSSEPTDILNNEGKPACCDNAFIPGVQAVNFISYAGQQFPADYQLSVMGNSTVNYFSKTLGSFSIDLDWKSYPFDKHFLAVDFMTPFQPTLNSGTYIEATDATLAAENTVHSGYKDAKRPSLTAIDLPSWRVIDTHFEVMNYTTEYRHGGSNADLRKGGLTLSELSGRGFRISVEVERQSKGFYIVVEVLPVCLIVAFSFCAFSLPIGNVKARFNVLAGQFLTLIVLQFVLYTVLPATFEVINPYLLICISYGLTICMCLEVIVADWLLARWKYSHKVAHKRHAQDAFRLWRQQALGAGAARQPRRSILDSANVRDRVMPPPAVQEGIKSPQLQAEEGALLADLERRQEQEREILQEQERQLQQLSQGWLWKCKPLREVRLRWAFMHQPNAESYCLHVAKRFDIICCSLMAVAYIVVVCTLFSLASVHANPSTDYS